MTAAQILGIVGIAMTVGAHFLGLTSRELEIGLYSFFGGLIVGSLDRKPLSEF